MKPLLYLVALFSVVSSVAADPSAISGHVRQADGQPVAGAQVALFAVTDLASGALAQATTDDVGYFALPLPGTSRPLPAGFALGRNYPNPFNPSTIIPYQLPVATPVRLEVFNVLGQHVKTLVDGQRPAGAHTALWDATDAMGQAVGAGVYFYRLSGGGAQWTRKMVLIDGQAGMATGGAGWTAAARPVAADAPVYGLTVQGAGFAAYVDPAFRVESGMAPVEVVVEAAHTKRQPADSLLGDVDGDGRVDIVDALLVAAYAVDPARSASDLDGEAVEDQARIASIIALGDVNGDGVLNLTDAALIGRSSVEPFTLLPAGLGKRAAAASNGTPKMYWTDRGAKKIQRANLDGTQIEDLITTGLSGPFGLALDAEQGKMYWTDYGADKIQRANLDGTQIETLITTGLSGPYGLTLDAEQGKLYWTDGGAKKIQRANLDGTQIEDLITTGLSGPFGLALDAEQGKMYWTDYGAGKIQRANLDGSQVETLITRTTGVVYPRGLALDAEQGKLYWTDGGAKKIQRANLDGTQIETLTTTGSVRPAGLALDVGRGKMYWMDSLTGKIQRANLDGTQIETLTTGTGSRGLGDIVLDTSGAGTVPIESSDGGDGGADDSGSSDDYSNTRSGATSLAVDGSRSGRLETGGDVDFFQVQVSRSGTLTVYTTGSTDTEGTLQNSSGSNLATNDDGGRGGNFSIEHAVSAGTYYVQVRGFSSSTTGSYTVHARFQSGGGGGGGGGGSSSPDLVVESPSVSDDTPTAGQSFTLRATVRNRGAARAAATTLRFYQSTDATIAPSDTQVGTESVSRLSASGTSAESIRLDAPSSDGTYYYGACVDAVSDESNTDNNCSTSVRVTVRSPDLVVESPSVSDDTPTAGQSFTLRATVRNHGAARAAATTLRFYQSTDATIAPSDTQVGTESVSRLSASATSAESIRLNAPSSEGTYYYGACVDAVSDESNTDNNCSTSVRVTVRSPDLIVESPSVSDDTPTAGQSFTLRATVRNHGAARAAATTLRFYQSTDATIAPSDTQVGTESVSRLSASATSDESIRLDAPSSEGTYYYGACVDAVSDESNTDNNCSTSVRVTVRSPDLIVESPSVSDDTPTAGQSFTLRATVRNHGAARAAATTLRFYQSTDATIAPSDTQVGTESVSRLSASGTSAESIRLNAPSSAGTYYYGACVDAVSNESNTDNNCSTSVRVTVRSPDLVVESPSVSDDTPTAGQSFTLRATVRNRGAARAAATTLRFYQSTDATIAPSDTQVGTESVSRLSASATSAESIRLDAPSSDGTYYYGACVDAVSNESNTDNNCSESLRVTVSSPDLIVESPSVSDDTPTPGQSFTLRATVRNRGAARAAATTLRFYQSTDATIAPSDTQVGTESVSRLSASGTSAESIRLDAPSSDGTYYYGACVDAVSNESNTDNNCSESLRVTVSSPDLIVESPSVSDDTPTAGQSFTLRATVRNHGAARAAATTLRFYQSTDATIAPSDTQVGTESVSRLSASGTSAESIRLNAPSSEGTYYYGACVDAVSNESNTDNNCSTSVRVTVRSPDLIVESPSVSDDTPTAGQSLTLRATVRNRGAARADGTTLRFYRSTDATIAPSDTQVGTESVSGLSASGTSAESIRLDAPSSDGTYYYGACVDAVSNESNTDNNCSESLRVTVSSPDLIVESPSVSDDTPTPGQSFTLRATVRNRGAARAAATTLRFYQSTDATIAPSDTQVGTESVSRLSASGTSAESIRLDAPSSDGTYYYGACVDAVSNESNTDNNCSESLRVTVSSPDLIVESPSVSDDTPTAGQSFTLRATVRNHGAARAAATTLRFYQSTDATIAPSDTQVGTESVSRLSASGTSAESIRLNAPSSEGTYYYGACVDAVSNESNTDNNCSTSVRVTVRSPDLIVESPSVSDDTPTAGQSLTLRATVRNRGAARADGTTLRFYRSTDATIAPSDTQVGTESVSGLSASGTSAESIRLDAPSSDGTYYYGACVDAVSDESNTDNNCSTSVRVTVRSPDLIVESPSVSDDTPTPGQSFTLRATVRNRGAARADATTLRFYRSTDATIAPSDTQVGTESVSRLSASATSDESIRLDAPSSEGTYYYGACVDAVSDESNTDNNCSESLRVTVDRACYVGQVVKQDQSCTAGGGEFRNVGDGCFVYTPSGSGTICAAGFDINGLRGTRSGDNFTITAIP